jgi:glycosyltransferase involved in cell wall biosynthesis
MLLAPLGGIGGTQRVVLELTRELQQRGHRLSTLLPDIPAAHKTREWFSAEGVPVTLDRAVPDCYRASARPSEHIRCLRDLIQRYQPDVVNFHYPTRRIGLKDVIAARLAGMRRIVVTVQHPTPFPERGRSEQWIVRASSVFCDRIVVSTPYMGELLKSAGVAARRLRTIPLGATPPAVHYSRAQARAELGIGEEEFILIAVARVVAHKGIETLLDAFDRVSAASKRLLVIGDGPQRAELAQRAAQIDPERIRFLGHVPDTAPYYAAADLFVLPSEGEGFGLVFVEAALHGLPTVAAGVWGVPYVVEHEGTGLLVPPRDPESVARAVSDLAADRGRLQQLGERARARAKSEFTAERMASRYEGVLFE